MRRAVHFAVLALVLLFAQHRAYVHPIEHLAGHGATTRETVASAPRVDAPCLECALLAGGGAVHGSGDGVSPVAAAPLAPCPPSAPRRAACAVVWFDSRAPPFQA